MATPKYLWSNNDSNSDKVYIYLNENGEKIYGNTVSNKSNISPYSIHSIYKNATCSGQAVTFIGLLDYKHKNVGLTDLSNNEYNKMIEYWNRG